MNDSEPKTERECRRVLNSINHAEQAPPPTEPYPCTEQQIDEHCKTIEDMHLTSHVDGELMFESVQIIKQLQSRTDLGHVISCDAMGGPDGCCGVLDWKDNGEVVCNECGLKWSISPNRL